MANLTVGNGQQYSRIADAIAAARDGDVVAVQAGTYTNDFATISRRITLQGVGGMVKMVATTAPPNGKAILTTGSDVTIDHFEFSGAAVADRNGAGIRYEAGNLTITNSYFHHNENGLLSGANADGSITIKNSEFAYNGIGDGQTHNLYVGVIRQLTVEESYFHDAIVGHEIKSRALNTTIRGSRIQNNAAGTASYEIDLPQGGNGLIENNTIQQGPNTQNPIMIEFGVEGSVHPSSSLVVRNNVIVSDKSRGLAIYNATDRIATMENNQVFGFGGIAQNLGTVGQTGTQVLASRPTLSTASPVGPSLVTPPATPPVIPTPPPAPVPVVPAPPPVVVVPPTTPAPATPVVVGSGADSLVLTMAADAYLGNPQFTVTVDGRQVGGTQTVTALRSAGATQSFTFNGGFGPGAHTVAVGFINDAWGGTAATDRNLFIVGATFNGTAVTGAAANLFSNGSKSFAVASPSATPPVVPPPVVTPPVGTPPTPVVPGAGPGSVVFKLSEDAWRGDAQAYVSIDGERLGGLQTITASHALGQTQTLSFIAPVSPGPHTAAVEFVNDAWGGTAATDRNLFIDSIEVGGQRIASGVALFSNGLRSFALPAIGLDGPTTPGTAASALAVDTTLRAPAGVLPTL